MRVSVSVCGGGGNGPQDLGPKARRPIFSTSSYTRTKCDPYDGTQKIQNYDCHRPPRAYTEVERSNHLHLRRRIYHDTANRMRIGRQSMYAFLQKAKCDEYDTMPKIQDHLVQTQRWRKPNRLHSIRRSYQFRTPPRAHTEVEQPSSLHSMLRDSSWRHVNPCGAFGSSNAPRPSVSSCANSTFLQL